MDKSVPAVDFNLTKIFLCDLRAAYDDLALFFHDPCGGEHIAVLWKPAAQEVKNDFQMAGMCGRRSTGNGTYECNFQQIVEDFRIIGRDLVEKIDVKS